MGRPATVLIDSCILIDFLSGVPPARTFLATAQGAAISRITWPIDGPVAEEAMTVRLHRRLELPDAIILATARVHGRTLVTRNTKDFAADEPGVHVPYRV